MPTPGMRLAAAFRPDEPVCVLRSYLRQRHMLLTYAGPHLQHMPKALTQSIVKLQHVVSDITGVTGLAILRALVAGQGDPVALALLRDDRRGQSEADSASRKKSTVSTMPKGLLDKLTHEEILDLIAYVAAGANPHSPLFQGGHEHGHGH